MRLSSGLLLASACSALGQFNQFTRFTNTSTSAVETSTSPTEFETSSVPPTGSIETTSISVESTASSSASAFAPIVLDLKDAILGPGASFYPPPDGDTILMSPVATDSTLKRRAGPVPVPVIPPLKLPNNAVSTLKTAVSVVQASSRVDLTVTLLSWNVTCGGAVVCPSGLRKRTESSPCAFQVISNGEVVQIQPIPESFSDSLEISTNPFILELENEFKLQQACGDVIVPVIIAGVTLKDAQGATPTPIPTPNIGVPTGSETGSSTETNSAEFTTNSKGETVFHTTNSQDFTTNSEGETVFPTTNSQDLTTNSEGETVFPTTNSQDFTTNSKGETVFPTGTGIATNSEGQTIFPTGTGVNTNSEGATTNSKGETIFPTGTSTGTVSSASSTSTSVAAGFPGDVGGFSLFGCAGSTASFPTYTLVESSALMDLDACAGLCEGRAYFGVHDTACYCGDVYDFDSTVFYNLDQCDIECPGDKTQFCGGEVENNLQARQVISRSILLTLYAKAEAAISLTKSVTQTVTSQETIITTFTTVTSGESIATEVVTATLVCVNGKCRSGGPNNVVVYIFVEVDGSDYDGQWVYISEPRPGGQQYIPYSCSGGKCASIKVYKPQQCPDWYNHKSFFVPSDCTTCAQGKISYQPWEMSWGTPDDCNDQVPSCNTFECPSQQGVVRPHQGISWNSTISHGGPGGGHNPSPSAGSGSNGGSSDSSGGSSGGNGGGSNGGASSGSGGDTEGSNVPGTKVSYPSTVPVISGAIKQASSVLSLLLGLLVLL